MVVVKVLDEVATRLAKDITASVPEVASKKNSGSKVDKCHFNDGYRSGASNNFRTEYVAVNTGTIQLFIEHGRLEEQISLDDLRNAGLAGKNDLIKLLGDGEIEASIDIEVHNASDSAQKKVEEAGGSITFVEN